MKKLKILLYALICLGIGTAKAQTLTNLKSFTNGELPEGSLILSGSTLYGMAYAGGANGDGYIFSISTNGTGFTDFLDFTGTAGSAKGANPTGSLILSGSTLYGMTSAGGTSGFGVIFSVSTSGSVYSVLHNFSGTDGETPYGSLLLTGSTLYGMTSTGGIHGDGNIFSVNTSGTTFSDLFDFKGTNGARPYGSLILSGSTLYGMTSTGGPGYNPPTSDGDGVIFSINISGSGFTDLLDFNGTNGQYPLGDLTYSGGTLYGMTEDGGVYSYGNIFSINTSGSGFTDLLDFDGTNGDAPNGSLALLGSTLYGMTEVGGGFAGGNIFSINISGSGFTDLYDFDPYIATNGLYPLDNVLLSNDVMYGMTWKGGSSGDGNIFSLTTCDLYVTTTFTNVVCNGGSTGSASATPNYGITPYTYSWSPSSQTTQTVTGLSAGTYTVTVTDHGGCTATETAIVKQPQTLSVIAYQGQSVHCYAGATLSIQTTIPGGTSPYTYSWTPGGSTNSSISGITGGSYTVTVTDNCGATASASATATQPSALSVSPNVTDNVLCYGGSDGSVSSSGSGGTAPYSYSWSGGGTNSTKTGLTAGTYTITVTDANGCTATATATITQPTELTAGLTSRCFLGEGTLTSNPSGGTSPYTYSWSTGATTSSIGSLSAGTYYVTVTDLNGCTASAGLSLSCPPEIPGHKKHNNQGSEDTIPQLADISLYPNPNNGQFTIAGLKDGMIIEIYDYTGKLIRNITESNKTMQFNLSNQANGLYLIRIISQDGTLAEQTRIIKTE